MKQFACPKCGSIDVFMEKNANQTGLYCGDCGRWIKWISKDEIRLVTRFIESNKTETNNKIIIEESEQDVVAEAIDMAISALEKERND